MENIQDFWQKYKGILLDDGVFYGALILLVGATSFGLGRLSIAPMEGRGQQAAITIAAAPEETGEMPVSAGEQGMYVGSKSSDKYHLPWCSGAARIKEENKVWFVSKEEAAAMGYTPAGNCEGIE